MWHGTRVCGIGWGAGMERGGHGPWGCDSRRLAGATSSRGIFPKQRDGVNKKMGLVSSSSSPPPRPNPAPRGSAARWRCDFARRVRHWPPPTCRWPPPPARAPTAPAPWPRWGGAQPGTFPSHKPRGCGSPTRKAIALLMPWRPLWAEPAEDSEDEEEEEEVENKDPPKKLKKKLPKDPPSGESREKKPKPKGECPGDRDSSSGALLSLASILAGTRGQPASCPHCCPGGLRGNHPPRLPAVSPLLAAPLPLPCPLLSPSLIGPSVLPGDKSDPDGKAKPAKSTKKESMSMFQVNGEKKEKKSKKKGTGRGCGGVAAGPTAPRHHPKPAVPGAA